MVKPKQQQNQLGTIQNGHENTNILSDLIEERPVTLLKSQINSIVKAVQKLLKNKNAKTRQGCFLLLTQLVNVLPGALNNHLGQIVAGVNYSLRLLKLI